MSSARRLPVNNVEAKSSSFLHHVPKVLVQFGGSAGNVQGRNAGAVSDDLIVVRRATRQETFRCCACMAFDFAWFSATTAAANRRNVIPEGRTLNRRIIPRARTLIAFTTFTAESLFIIYGRAYNSCSDGQVFNLGLRSIILLDILYSTFLSTRFCVCVRLFLRVLLQHSKQLHAPFYRTRGCPHYMRGPVPRNSPRRQPPSPNRRTQTQVGCRAAVMPIFFFVLRLQKAVRP